MRSGGLKDCITALIIVQHHDNFKIPDRCFIKLIELYNSLCPDRLFHLKCLTQLTPTCWFSSSVSCFCDLGNIPWAQQKIKKESFDARLIIITK